MRRLQSVLAGLPGGGLHHHGTRRSRRSFAKLGGADWSCIVTTLIRNGTVVTAAETKSADILIEGEKIKEVRAGIPAEAAGKIIDAQGMLLLPGGIDVHTHLDMPFGGTTSSDDFETGT